jgi:GST-like protein
MAGQAHHFRNYAREDIAYAIARYTREVTRSYRVMNRRLAEREFLAGPYSIADMACSGWIKPHERQGQALDDLPHLQRWFEAVGARPAVKRAMAVGEDKRRRVTDFKTDDKAYELLFGDGQLR